MKKLSSVIEKRRVKKGAFTSSERDGNNGVFQIVTPDRVLLNVVASDQDGWEHVSVSPARAKRCPTWEEMCFIKDQFWDEDEVVVQYHPAKADYVKCHPHTLHLWKPIGQEIPKPPAWMVGPVGVEVQV